MLKVELFIWRYKIKLYFCIRETEKKIENNKFEEFKKWKKEWEK